MIDKILSTVGNSNVGQKFLNGLQTLQMKNF